MHDVNKIYTYFIIAIYFVSCYAKYAANLLEYDYKVL